MSINLTITVPLQAVIALSKDEELRPNGIDPDLQKVINHAMKDAVKVLHHSISALAAVPPSPISPPDTPNFSSFAPPCFELSAEPPRGGPESPPSIGSTTPDASTPMQKPVPSIPLPDLPEVDDADFSLGFRDLQNRSHTMKVESTLSIRELMCRILEELDIWQHGLILLWSGRVLCPKLSVNSIGLKEGDELSLILDTSVSLRHEIRTEHRDRPTSVDFTNSSREGFAFAVKKPDGFSLVQAYGRTPVAEIALYFQRREGIRLSTQRWVCDGEPIFDGREVVRGGGRKSNLEMVNISQGSVVRLVVAVEQPFSGWKYT